MAIQLRKEARFEEAASVPIDSVLDRYRGEPASAIRASFEVLTVSESRSVTWTLCGIALAQGHHPVAALDAATALRIVSRRSRPLVLVDLCYPELREKSFLSALAKHSYGIVFFNSCVHEGVVRLRFVTTGGWPLPNVQPPALPALVRRAGA